MSEKHSLAARTVLDVVPLVMRTLANHMRRSPQALRPAHYGVLMILRHGARNLTELAERMAVSAPTMSNSISILEQHGWVQRVRDEADHRKVLIALSEDGRRMLVDVLGEAVGLLSEALSSLSEPQCDTLMDGLMILRDCLCQSGDSEILCATGESPCGAQQTWLGQGQA